MKKRIIAATLVLNLAFLAVFSGSTDADAAKKVKLSAKSKTLEVNKSFSLKLKNGSKKAKVTWKTSNKKVASLSKQVKKGNKASVKVTGKKRGTAKITATYKLGKKKPTKFICTVKVGKKKPAPTAVPTVAPTITTAPTAVPTATPEPTQKITPTPKPTRTPTPTPTPKPIWSPDVQIYKTDVDVVIDGIIDEAWSFVDAMPIANWTLDPAEEGAPEKAAQSSNAYAKIMWTDAKVYVMVSVDDPEIDLRNEAVYYQDSIELFFDEYDDKRDWGGGNEFQYRTVLNREAESIGSLTDKQYWDGEAITTEFATTETGYVVEFAIPLHAAPVEGGFAGIEIQVNDASAGFRNGTWNLFANPADGDPIPYDSTAVFGNCQYAIKSQESEKDIEYLWELGDVTINDTFSDYFISGVTVNDDSLEFGEDSEYVKHHFGSVTMVNENKMEYIVNDNATDEYPNGIDKANVDAYYETDGEAEVILDYEKLEEILSYCKDNGLKLRYNALVSHYPVREYFFLQDYNWAPYSKEDYIANGWDVNNYHKLADKETMKKRLNEYISQIIEYIYSNGYGDVVYAYDVIYEATNGGENNKHRYYVDTNAVTASELLVEEKISGALNFQTNGGVRTSTGKFVTSESSADSVEDMIVYEGRVPANDSYWYATMGPDYLYLAFLYAHDAIDEYYEQYKDEFGYTTKPSLIYTDYNQRENDHISLAKYINLACNLENGTSGEMYCDGIGIEAHSLSESNQERMIKAVVDEGFECQITELDEATTGDEQAEKLKNLYQIYMKYSKNGEYGRLKGEDYIGVTSVTHYAIYDEGEEYRPKYIMELYEGDNPELSLSPKPAFFAILQAGGVECGYKVY